MLILMEHNNIYDDPETIFIWGQIYEEEKIIISEICYIEIHTSLGQAACDIFWDIDK